jgi:hypothetical protein
MFLFSVVTGWYRAMSQCVEGDGGRVEDDKGRNPELCIL